MIASVASFLLLAAAQGATEPPKYDLKWRPRVGQVLEYAVRAKAAVAGQMMQSEAVFRGVVRSASSSGGVAVLIDARQRVNTTPDGTENPPDVLGVWLQSQALADETDKLGELGVFARWLTERSADEPVTVGQKWTEKDEDEEEATRYEVLSVEDLKGSRAVKVACTGSEASSGSWLLWLRVKDGALLRAELTANGSASDGAGGNHALEATVTMELTSEKEEPRVATEAQQKLLPKVAEVLRGGGLKAAGVVGELNDYEPSFEEDPTHDFVMLTPKKADAEGNRPRVRVAFSKAEGTLRYVLTERQE